MRKERARAPRPADLAITANRMIFALVMLTWTVAYQRPKRNYFGSALETIFVSMVTSIATRDGKPHTVTEISRKLMTPDSTVRRQLAWLERHSRVTRAGNRYVANLDYLDRKMSRATLDTTIKVIEETLEELKRLRELFADTLPAEPMADGADATAPPPPDQPKSANRPASS